MLTNFERGLLHKGSRHSGFHDRLRRWVGRAPAAPKPAHIDSLYNDMVKILDARISDAHFLATERPVTCNLDLPAVVIVTHVAMRIWLGLPKSDFMPEIDELTAMRDACPDLPARIRHKGQTLGRPDRAIWITPLYKPIADYLDRARDLARDPHKPANDPSFATIVDTAWELLGLSQYEAETCLVAVITNRTIRELLSLPPGPSGCAVMGPSVIEGGTHTRWRHWSEDYGRTYRLFSGSATAGLAEAVRRPVPLEEVAEFLYLGSVTRRYGEDNQAFAQAIGATDEVSDILRRLHAITSI